MIHTIICYIYNSYIIILLTYRYISAVFPPTTALDTTITSGKYPSTAGTTTPPPTTTEAYPPTGSTTDAPATSGPTNDYPSTLELIHPSTKLSTANPDYPPTQA